MSNNTSIRRKYRKLRPKDRSAAFHRASPAAHENGRSEAERLCPLSAKDSTWVDSISPPELLPETSKAISTSGDEDVLQLVECEEGVEAKPIALMFPGLIDSDPSILEGILNKRMSTTDVTRHLVNLGEHANFSHIRKANRLIPRDAIRLESLIETTCSQSSDTDCSDGYYGDTEYTSGGSTSRNTQNSASSTLPIPPPPFALKENIIIDDKSL